MGATVLSRQLMAVAGAVLIALDGAPSSRSKVCVGDLVDKRVDMGGFSLYLLLLAELRARINFFLISITSV
jgi:hypothetical protein